MKLKGVFIFVSGAGIGAAISYLIAKDRISKRYEAEIDSVHDVYRKEVRKYKELAGVKEEKAGEKKVKETYEEEKKSYKVPSGEEVVAVKKKKAKKSEDIKPQIISMEEFGDTGKYEEIILTCYSDGIFADEGQIIDDIYDLIGTVDVDEIRVAHEMCVRNHMQKADYDIIYDPRTYDEAVEDGAF